MSDIIEPVLWCRDWKIECKAPLICHLMHCPKEHGRSPYGSRPVSWAECWPLADVPLDELKARWDDIDTWGHDCDNIHWELNRRGEGEYCAV